MTDQPAANTDRELYRENPDDYYSSSIHVTEGGAIGINVDGTVITTSLRGWHQLAAERDQALAQARDEGIRQAVAWLQSDYPYGTGPDWRERGVEWIEERAAEERRERIRGLVDRSSFGAPEVKALRESVPADVVARTVARARELASFTVECVAEDPLASCVTSCASLRTGGLACAARRPAPLTYVYDPTPVDEQEPWATLRRLGPGARIPVYGLDGEHVADAVLGERIPADDEELRFEVAPPRE